MKKIIALLALVGGVWFVSGGAAHATYCTTRTPQYCTTTTPPPTTVPPTTAPPTTPPPPPPPPTTATPTTATPTTAPPTTVPPTTVPPTTIVVTTTSTVIDKGCPPGQFPQGPIGNEPCGPTDLCSADGKTRNWSLLPCDTTTTVPPTTVPTTLPPTGLDDAGQGILAAALLCFGLGLGAVTLARRNS